MTGLIAIIDPLLTVDPRLRKRLEQIDLKVVRYALLFQTSVWPVIYILHFYFNDKSKSPHSLYFKYRFGMATAILTIGAIGYVFKNSSILLRVCLVFLASILCYVQSWSMTLGPYISHAYLVWLPLIVLASFARSLVFSALWLIFLVLSSKVFWGPHTEVRFLFSDTTIALMILLAIHIVRRIWLDSKILHWINEDLRRESLLAQQTFDKQIKSFISPVLIQNIEKMTAQGANFIAALDSVLKRKKATVAALFSDMRNFSERSDNIEFVEKELIPSSSGIIDSAEQNAGIAKQIGDAVLVYYSVDDSEEALLRCLKDGVRCSVQESIRVNSLGRSRAERFFTMTYGVSLVGNMASLRHREATIIGSPANLAARIDALTKEDEVIDLIAGRAGVLISSDAYGVVRSFSKDWDVQALDLAKANLEIRSYEDQKEIFFFPSNSKNIVVLNKLLSLNNLSPLQLTGQIDG